METLKEITEKEQQLISVIESLKGTMDERYLILQESGVFKQYNDIHRQYANMSETDSEALKRAVFLIWYSRLEPEFLTGIDELAADSVSKTMIILNDYLKNGIIDAELEWMLNYYSSWGYLFEDYKHMDAIREFLLTVPQESKLPKFIDRQLMANRGQMGHYWNSLNLRVS